MEDKGQEEISIGSAIELAKVHNKYVVPFLHFHNEKSQVREYGTAMLYHRWIDANLSRAIKARLKDIRSPREKLFKFPGGLSTFTARCHLGSLLGLYGATTYGDMLSINDIRNDFAHPKWNESHEGEIEILGFEHPEISKRCHALGFIHATPLKGAFTKWNEWTAEQKYCQTCELIGMGLGTFAFPNVQSVLREKDDMLP